MGTIVEKLLRIKETKTGFKDLIIEKGGVITETTTFHEYIDEARKLIEGGKVVVEEASATAVPNEGTIDRVYFNTNLSTEEVDQIIDNANLDWMDLETGAYAYVVCGTDTNNSVIIMAIPVSEGVYKYCIIGQGGSRDEPIISLVYVSIGVGPMMGAPGVEGWILEESGIPDGFISINGNLLSIDPSTKKPAGLQNEALKYLISSTPFNAGKQPVPNSGYVESIKFNTSLSPEEVDKIIIDANLERIVAEGYIAYYIAPRESLIISDLNTLTNGQQSGCMIMHQDNNKNLIPCYLSPSLAEMSGADFVGWNPDFNGILTVNQEVISSADFGGGVKEVGLQNDKLVDLFYIGTDLFKAELTGTYEAVTTDITENGEVDLTTYWDNQQMPIKVSVNIEAGASGEAIEVATEEEMDAVLVEENIGKFYKFTGESTDKYTQDAIYLVQDAENPIFEDEIKNITTEAEMDAALVEENIGKLFLYAGETCDKYIKDIIYMVQNKENPIIDVPQPGVPLQPATEEEMNKLLVNENVGKVFLYTGETNENFTNGEYYIIEEVTE